MKEKTTRNIRVTSDDVPPTYKEYQARREEIREKRLKLQRQLEFVDRQLVEKKKEKIEEKTNSERGLPDWSNIPLPPDYYANSDGSVVNFLDDYPKVDNCMKCKLNKAVESFLTTGDKKDVLQRLEKIRKVVTSCASDAVGRRRKTFPSRKTFLKARFRVHTLITERFKRGIEDLENLEEVEDLTARQRAVIKYQAENPYNLPGLLGL